MEPDSVFVLPRIAGTSEMSGVRLAWSNRSLCGTRHGGVSDPAFGWHPRRRDGAHLLGHLYRLPTSGEATISVDLSQRESTKRQLFETLSGCHEPCFDSRHLT